MTKPPSHVDLAYGKLHEMAVNFEFKPEERLNESALSIVLNVSRTPLREALNRLVAEGLLTFKNGRGFFCRALSPVRIHDLYEARAAVESEGILRAIERASDAEIKSVSTYLSETEPKYKTCENLTELVEMDEEFHRRLVELSNNGELLRLLDNLNHRTRYVRLINLQLLRAKDRDTADKGGKLSAHRIIIDHVARRDCEAAVRSLRDHINKRSDQITEAVRIAYSQLYVPN